MLRSPHIPRDLPPPSSRVGKGLGRALSYGGRAEASGAPGTFPSTLPPNFPPGALLNLHSPRPRPGVPTASAGQGWPGHGVKFHSSAPDPKPSHYRDAPPPLPDGAARTLILGRASRRPVREEPRPVSTPTTSVWTHPSPQPPPRARLALGLVHLPSLPCSPARPGARPPSRRTEPAGARLGSSRATLRFRAGG